MATTPLVLRLILSVTYVGVGVFVLLSRPFRSPVFDLIFASACIVYGVFRGYRAYMVYSEDKEDEA